MSTSDKPLAWLHDEIKTPPLSKAARLAIGRNCHELRIDDENASWRVVYRIDDDAIVIAAIFAKKTPRTPKRVIDACRRRLRNYDDEAG